MLLWIGTRLVRNTQNETFRTAASALRQAGHGWAFALALSCTPPSGAAHPGSAHPLLGEPAPAFELPSPDGQATLTLAEHAGKVVIVDFWATWCEPCRDSFPAYQTLIDQLGSQLVVVGISVDETPAGIAAFVQETGVRFPVAWDEGQAAAETYRPSTMPTSFIIDSNGLVRFVHVGYRRGDAEVIRKEVESLF